jgi:hypothetical protein
MFIEIFIIIMMIVILAIIFNGIEDYSKDREAMSFMEAMDLVNLPIITFYNEGTKLNLLLDTGSSMNVINSPILKTLAYTKLEGSGTVYGMEGNIVDIDYISMKFTHGKDSYSSTFQVVDMQKAFDKIKEEYGVTIHGILGSAFFKDYEYILDFETLVAYSKK